MLPKVSFARVCGLLVPPEGLPAPQFRNDLRELHEFHYHINYFRIVAFTWSSYTIIKLKTTQEILKRQHTLSPNHEVSIAIYYLIVIEVGRQIHKWDISNLKLRACVSGFPKSTMDVILTCLARVTRVFLCSDFDFFSFLAGQEGRLVVSFSVPPCSQILSPFHM